MVCLIWTIIGLLEYRKRDRAQRMLSLFGVVTTALYFCHYLHFNGVANSWSDALWHFCNLSVYPLYAIYVERLTHRETEVWKQDLPWLLPAVIVCGLNLAGYPTELGSKMIFALVSIAAGIKALVDLLRFRKRVENYYASPEGKRLDPILVLVTLQLFTMVSSIVSNFVGREPFMNNPMLAIPALIFSTLLFGIFYIGFATEIPAEEVRSILYASPVRDMGEEQQNKLMEKIEQQMQTEELFRTQGLTIMELATAVGSNRTYVSNTINQIRGCSFSDYVNGYRVRFAQEQMLNSDTPSLTEIAAMAGFTDRTSFYRCFKKITGTNPSSWLSGQKEEA